MPTVTFRGRDVACPDGAVLRDALLDAGLSPHNGRAAALNCRGHGTCGTCAVALSTPDGDDPVDAGAVDDPSARERARLSFPPHSPESGLRLSCQVRVRGDLVVRKYGGFWGQDVPEGGADRGASEDGARSDADGD
ncbi:2Fe-2S iron-sulfur cluster-binding protein [Halobium salinum]|uniref:2Fe-2S iron-sulfur cluster-binding protein n=1 Tax=Halobium salinum TaxID=1364940 RepID=A0ABD5P7B7_9EURY|nr:2Fe-2S iron-sulfur cluster-binding protein [Halobium salinum]